MKYYSIYKTDERFSDIVLLSEDDVLTGLVFESAHTPVDLKDSYEKDDLNIFKKSRQWLDIYFCGNEPDFKVDYRIDNLTDFRTAVIDELNKIPFGSLTTYNEIAKTIALNRGQKRMSAQAVGGAVGWNPICIMIPCHRVISQNKSLTGYGGGMKNKVSLLQNEGIDLNNYIIPTKGTKL